MIGQRAGNLLKLMGLILGNSKVQTVGISNLDRAAGCMSSSCRKRREDDGRGEQPVLTLSQGNSPEALQGKVLKARADNKQKATWSKMVRHNLNDEH